MPEPFTQKFEGVKFSKSIYYKPEFIYFFTKIKQKKMTMQATNNTIAEFCKYFVLS